MGPFRVVFMPIAIITIFIAALLFGIGYVMISHESKTHKISDVPITQHELYKSIE